MNTIISSIPHQNRPPAILTRLASKISLISLVVILSAAMLENTDDPVMASVGSLGVTPGMMMPRNGMPESSKKLLQFTAGGHVIGFGDTGVYVAAGDHALKTGFVGARRVKPQARRSSRGASRGASSKAQPLERVTYRDLWDGVTLVYERDQSGIIKSTYRIAPHPKGSDPVKCIQLAYNTAAATDANGNLVLGLTRGNMVESAPVAWQEIRGRKVPVDVSFTISAKKKAGFHVSAYDPAWPLIIDPTLTWNTFLGGTATDLSRSIAVDAAGNVYVTGDSNATWGTPILPFNGTNAFVAKLNSTGTLQWNTFLGAGIASTGSGITVDAAGNVYVTGESKGTWGAPIRPFSVGPDAFVAKLNGSGILQWNTFLGSASNERGRGIAVDAAGNVYVTGDSSATWGTPVRPFGGSFDAFVAKLNTGGVLQWNTFLGGVSNDHGRGIAVDAASNVYVTGDSNATWGAPVSAFGGGFDAFAAKLNTGGVLQWNTFLGGGAADDFGSGIAVDAASNVYVTGNSNATWGAPVIAFAGGSADAFVASLNNNGTLQWNTFLGGGGIDAGFGIAVDAASNVYAAGKTGSTWGAPIRAFGGADDAFVAKIGQSTANLAITKTAAPTPVQVGNNLTYTVTVTNNGSTDPATGVTLTDTLPAGVTFVSATPGQGTCNQAGGTVTCNLGNVAIATPVTITIVVTPMQTGQITNTATVAGNEIDPTPGNDTAQVTTTVNVPPSADLAVTKTAAPNPVQAGSNLTYTVTVTNNGPTDPATGVTLTDTLPAGVTFVSATPSQGTPCTQVAGTVTCTLGNVTMAAPATVTIVVTPAQAGQITNTATVAGNETDPTPGNDTAQVTTTVNAVPPPPGPGADLTISKLASVNPVTVGDLLIYTLNIQNRGPLAASDILVSDNLPASLDFILASASQGSCTGTVNILCHLGTLANGASATVFLVTVPTSVGVVHNVAMVRSTAIRDPLGINNSTVLVTQVDAAVSTASASLALNAASFVTGDTLILSATAIPGASPVVADVYLAIQLPDGTVFFMQSDGGFSSTIAPALTNWTVAPFTGPVFSYTFNGSEPPGGYEWFLILTQTGSANIIGQIYTASFTFTP